MTWGVTWEVWIASACVVVVLFSGGMLTEIGPWYRALRTPSWQPPDWLFGPVWTTIGVLTTWSAVLAWRSGDGAQRGWVIALFAANAVLNVLWSLLFFKLRRPDWALPEAAALWLSVAALVAAFAGWSPRAALLLAPYLLWVGIAFFLNRAVVRLNRPFGRAATVPAIPGAALPARERRP